MSNHIFLRASHFLTYIILFAVTAVQAPPSLGQNANIKKQLTGVDFEGIQQLRLSPDGELAAGITGLYDNPGGKWSTHSLVKVWSVKTKKLLHEFPIPGEAYEFAFSPDSSIVLAADKTGNLGHSTRAI